jgi:hypothetical protein
MADKGNGPAHMGLKLALAFALVLAAGVGLALGLTDRTSAQQARPQGTPAPIPVSTARSPRQDVPRLRRSVQQFRKLLMARPMRVRSPRVKRNSLTVVDPRPFQAALDAVAKQTRPGD